LATLQLQIRHGDWDPKVEVITDKNVDEFIPVDLLQLLNYPTQRVKAWVETIKLAWGALSGTSAVEAKNIYLEKMKEWHLFGSSIFCVEQRVKPKKALVAINKEGLFILNRQSEKKDLVHFFNWREIATWRVDHGKSFHITAGSLAKPVKLSLFCKHPDAINISFNDYLNMAVEIAKAEAERRKLRPLSSATERLKDARKSRISARLSRKQGITSAYREFNFEDVQRKNAPINNDDKEYTSEPVKEKKVNKRVTIKAPGQELFDFSKQ